MSFLAYFGPVSVAPASEAFLFIVVVSPSSGTFGGLCGTFGGGGGGGGSGGGCLGLAGNAAGNGMCALKAGGGGFTPNCFDITLLGGGGSGWLCHGGVLLALFAF